MKKVKRIPKQPDEQCRILDHVYGSWSLGDLDETKAERTARQTYARRSKPSVQILGEGVQEEQTL
jgi:hypothetical protein